MILIVDDNQDNIFSLKALLELHQFVVDTALSGQEALRRVLKNAYSLIILDVQMPEMDGFEVAEAISGYSKSRDVPIIFLSANNTEKNFIARGYHAGGVDYVTKPFDADVLLLKVKTFYRLSEQKRRLVQMEKFLREEIEFRRRAENELEQKVEELKSTLESIPQIAFTTCPAGGIELVNHHWFKYSDSSEKFPRAEGHSVLSCIEAAIVSKKQFVQEIKIKPLHESEYRFQTLCLTPVQKGADIIRWVGVLTDIHEQKTASHLLEQKVEERTQALKDINKKLEDRNLELQRFAFIASHDLQEPLRKIQIFSDIVVEKITNDPVHAQRFLQKINLAAQKMRVLIKSLLEYSRLPDQRRFEAVDLNQVVQQVLQDFEIQIKEKKARFEIGTMPSLEAIPLQIHQVFHNLISNSLKFSSAASDPVVTINAQRVADKSTDAPATADGSYCRIVVSDNGIGFDQAYAGKVFEMFQRLNQREVDEGAGIGLAIVKKVIEKHDGLIEVSSHENQGTRFTIVLPVQQLG